jgi:ABC-type multidrug transport system fused ATPase/permease subunit
LKNILLKILFVLDKNQKKKLILFSGFLLFITLIELISIATLYQLSKVLLEPTYIKEIISYKPISFLSENLAIEMDVKFLIYFIILVFILKFLFNFIYHYCLSKFVENVRKKLTSRLTKNYLLKEYKFFLSRGSSSLIRNITSEVGSFSLGIINNFLILKTEILIFFGILCILLLNDYNLVMTILITMSVIGLLFYYFTHSISSLLSIQKLKYSNLFLRSVIYLFKSIKNIKIYNSEIFHTKEIEKNLEKISEAQIFFSISSQLPRMLMETFIVVLVGIFLLTKKIEVANSDLISSIALFVISSFRMIPSASKILACINQIRFNAPSVNVIYNDLRGKSYKFKKKPVLIDFKNKIAGNKISFKYSKQKNYLFKDLNFKFFSGKLIGIVGSSGVGKSTLFDLMTKLLSPLKGSILIDNKRILDWRKIIHNFSYATQETDVFNDTLKNNIINGNYELLSKDVSDDKIKNILDQCGLKSFYRSLPQGIHSIISEDGRNISVGQRQRIGIARCLLKNCRIWLLDEITSSLDSANARLILKNIKNVSRESLKILITHNYSNLEICDEVYKISNKKLIKI